MGIPFKFSPRGSQLMINPVGIMFFIIDTTEDDEYIKIRKGNINVTQGNIVETGDMYYSIDGSVTWMGSAAGISWHVQPGSHLVEIIKAKNCSYVSVEYSGGVRYISSNLRNLDIRSPIGSTSTTEKVYSLPDTITSGNFSNMTKGSINLNTLAVNGTKNWQFSTLDSMFKNSPIVRGSRSKFLNRCYRGENTTGADTAFIGTNTTP